MSHNYLNFGHSLFLRLQHNSYFILSELLTQYIAQRDELERLGRELQELDREADELLGQFSVAAEQYSQCAGA